MTYVMVTVVLAVLALPYMVLVFTDDHHAIAYGATTVVETAPEPEPVAATPPALEEAEKASDAAVSETAARATAGRRR